MMLGRLLSYWAGSFSGAMLNFGGVNPNKVRATYPVGMSQVGGHESSFLHGTELHRLVIRRGQQQTFIGREVATTHRAEMNLPGRFREPEKKTGEGLQEILKLGNWLTRLANIFNNPSPLFTIHNLALSQSILNGWNHHLRKYTANHCKHHSSTECTFPSRKVTGFCFFRVSHWLFQIDTVESSGFAEEWLNLCRTSEDINMWMFQFDVFSSSGCLVCVVWM